MTPVAADRVSARIQLVGEEALPRDGASQSGDGRIRGGGAELVLEVLEPHQEGVAFRDKSVPLGCDGLGSPLGFVGSGPFLGMCFR